MGGTGRTGGRHCGQLLFQFDILHGNLGLQNRNTSGNIGAQHGHAGLLSNFGGTMIGKIGMKIILCMLCKGLRLVPFYAKGGQGVRQLPRFAIRNPRSSILKDGWLRLRHVAPQHRADSAQLPPLKARYGP